MHHHTTRMGQAHDQRLPLRLVEFDVCRQIALRPDEAALVQAARQQPQALAIVHQHLHARAALVGKQVGVVQACGTKDFDHAAQGFVGPGAHVQGCRGQPQCVDADHVGGPVSSQPLAQPGAALGGSCCRPLQAHGAGATAKLQADGLCGGRTGARHGHFDKRA